MKLSRIYCNLPEVFGPIAFNAVEGDPRLSVVFARITQPKDTGKDSHNLGKTTLIHLIDFLLLKDIGDGKHFLARHAARFSRFVFFMELRTHNGGYVTVRRSVEAPTRIALKRHDQGGQDFTSETDVMWDHADVGIETARELLDAYLDLRTVKPWDYRKGVSYFLRTQADYQDYFQIAKFLKGQDLFWKPYVAHVLGLKHRLIERKYRLDQEVEDAVRRKAEKQAEVQVDEREFTKLGNQIEIQREEVAQTAARLEAFDFREEEKRVNKDVVERIEREIASTNDDIYNLDYDLSQMRKSLESGFGFKIEAVRQIFEETQTYVPEGLFKDYEQLVAFNRRVTHERNTLLRRQIKELEAKRQGLETRAEQLNEDRKRCLEILRNADTFAKFKALQRDHSAQRAHLTYLEGQLERLNKVLEISQELRELEIQRDQIVAEISADVARRSPVQRRIALEFHGLVRRVLGLRGQLYVTMNRNGNVDFKIETELEGPSHEVSSQSEGTSYKKLLCALFDIALLKAYATAPFYHFVYHDGIFEGLDTRKRRVLLDVLRETVAEFGIQYILSVIDSDLPRDDDDHKMLFPVEELVLELHDGGAEGRLFRMPEF